jgi:hypothetical protein
MATTDVRSRLSQIAFKVESTVGTDSIAGTPAAGDYVTCDATIRFTQDTTPNPVETGSYDSLPPIPGALRAEIQITLMMVGSGTAGTAPEWGRLLRSARMIETVTAAAVGAPTAAAAGTTTSATLATPFSTTAQQYRGMPILLTGNPAAGATDIVQDYTAGRVASFYRTYTTLTTSTLAQVPVNVLYSPTSDDSAEAWLTVYAWTDELRHRIVGAKATRLAIGLTNGRPAALSMTFTGRVVDRFQNVARPTGYAPVTRQPPIWRSGMSQLNRALASVSSAGFDMGLSGYVPENPEASEGYDPAIITAAQPRVTLDPFSHSTNTPLRSGVMDAQSSATYGAIWGTTAGNRFALSAPASQVLDINMADRGGLAVDTIVLAPTIPDAGFFLACF